MAVKVRERPPGSGKWWIFIDYKGRRKAKYVGSAKAARVAADKIQAKLTLGEFSVEEKKVQTFKAYREHWMRTYVSPHCKYSTFKSYESVFKNHLAIFDARALDEITRQDIAELIANKLGEGQKSRGTVRNIVAPLREMFNHAMEQGILKSNPAACIGRFTKHTSSKANRLKINPLTRDEVQTLLETAKTKYGFDTFTLVLCAARTGMRMGELFGLQWPDLDFNTGFVQVQRNWVRGRLETPKNHQLRRVDMSTQLAEALQELRRGRKVLFFTIRAEAEQLRAAGELEDEIPRLLACKHGYVPEFVRTIVRTKEEMPAWVFINEEGRPLDHNNFRRRTFEKLLETAGMRRIRFHDLRHTFASLLLQQGESPQYVREQMGHHSIQVTVDIYGHLIPGTNRRAVDRLDDQPKKQAMNRKSHRPNPSATTAQPTRLRIAARRLSS